MISALAASASFFVSIADCGSVGSDVDYFIFHGTPVSAGFPGTVVNLFDGFFIIRSPVPDRGGQGCFRSIGRHIDIVADTVFAAFFSSLLRTGGVLDAGR